MTEFVDAEQAVEARCKRVLTGELLPSPWFLVSADSKGLRFRVSRLESAVVSVSTSVEYKGLTMQAEAGTSLLAGELTKEAVRCAVS